jgi:hypothetical protein
MVEACELITVGVDNRDVDRDRVGEETIGALKETHDETPYSSR